MKFPLFVQLNTSTFGHFLTESELYIKKMQTNHQKVYFYPQKMISNSYWWACISENFLTLPELVGKTLDRVFSLLFWRYKRVKSEFIEVSITEYATLKVHEDMPKILFKDYQLEHGNQIIREAGFTTEKPMVGVCLRDEAYDELFGKKNVEAQRHRNMPVSDYREYVETILSSGFSALRFGRYGKTITHDSPGNFFDFSTKGLKYEDYLDFVFASKVNFFFSTGTGIDTVAFAMRKRVYVINNFPVGTAYLTALSPLYLPQDYISISSGSKMTIDNIYAKGLENTRISDLWNAGIKIQPKRPALVSAFINLVISIEKLLSTGHIESSELICELDIVEEFCKRFQLERRKNVLY
jgi:putative glycosyltransferase (TIGR04372 family)